VIYKSLFAICKSDSAAQPGVQPEKAKARIIEVKPNFHGVSVDFNP
jgi:hypothetical protein